MLIEYIKLGGSVCLIAGTGHGDSKLEAAGWNKLLTALGIYLEPSYNDITGVLPVTSPAHPLFAGVKALYQYLGQTIHLLPDSKASIIMTSASMGLIGLAEVPVAKQPAQTRPAILSDGAVINLQSSEGDVIHRGMSSEVVMHPSKSSGRDYTATNGPLRSSPATRSGCGPGRVIICIVPLPTPLLPSTFPSWPESPN
jgi:hypothetical protein